MSSHYETESGLVWLIRDGIIPSNIVWLCKEAMRRKMLSFIEHEVDLTTFAKPALIVGDLQRCKREMVRVMELIRTPMYLICICGGERILQTDLEMVSNRVDDQMQKMSKKILDQIQNQNASYILYLPFTHEMRTELKRRLIEAAKSYFATRHWYYIEKRRRDSWIYQRPHNSQLVMEYNRAANWKAEHARSRAKFLTRAGLQPPQVLRVIDIEATCRQGERVVLIDYWADATVQRVGYTAISHTFGMPVYEAFDCPCASECSAKVRPRCSNKACPHEPLVGAAARSVQHKIVVNDILKMCDILRKTGVNYAWHDGVCIAQHDEVEVKETIKHMGWIYAYAKETVIFLHYVGTPMAPIRISHDNINELCCRWHTRVWTLQEAALSKCRRYCVRVGPLGDCQSMEEFEEKIALWYRDDSSAIEIMEEERFFEFVKEIYRVLGSLCVNLSESIPNDAADGGVIVESNWMWEKACAWYECTQDLLQILLWTCFEFPTMQRALYLCSSRDSKHRGDTMNSILALAEVKDFVAAKDVNVEASTIEFFKRQGQLGLATALFSINRAFGIEDKEYITEERRHTWPPILWSRLTVVSLDPCELDNMRLKVLEDGRMKLRAEMMCVKVRFTVHEHKNCVKSGEDYNTQDHELVILPNNSIYLDMDLTHFQQNAFKASIAECIMGSDVYISDIMRCNSQIPVLQYEIEDGESFHAYLVIPIQMPHVCLIVQGRLDAHVVSKVGVFMPTLKFLEMVCQLDLRHIGKLIII